MVDNGTKPDKITWHRPEYRGRQAELVAVPEVARIAGVTRDSVYNWINRLETFPEPVKTERGGPTLYVLTEIVTWLLNERPVRSPSRDREKSRLKTVLATYREQEAALESELDHVKAVISHIEGATA